jgi:membrane protein implicated in regulation of membrane protease activity
VAESERAALLLLARIIIALAMLVVGGPLIYMFGAGFFSNYGIGLPTPWNVVATIFLALALLFFAWRVVRGPTSPEPRV